MLLIFCPPVLDIKTVAQWEADYNFTLDFTQNNPRALSKDSSQYYTLGLSIDGNRAMFEATGKLIYIDRCLDYINKMINDAVLSSTLSASQFKDTYLGWIYSLTGDEQSLGEFYCWRYVVRVLDVIKDYNLGTSYQTAYNNIMAFTERNIWQKWYARGATSWLYRTVVHICSHVCLVAHFLRRRSTNPTIVSQATILHNNIDNLGIPSFNGSNFRAQIVSHPVDARMKYWKSYWEGIPASGKPVELKGSDTSHGAAFITYVIEMYERGYGSWSIEDLSGFAALFQFLWINSNSTWYWLIGPSGTDVYSPHNINDGFNKLGRFNVNIQKLIESVSSARTAQHYGNGALNAKKLLGG